MGRRGPKPTPTAMLRLRGSWRGNIRKGEPMPTRPGRPLQPPAWLDATAKALWKELSGELRRCGLLTKCDRASFAGLCEAWSEYRRASDKIEQYGATMTAPSGYEVQSPWVSIRNKAWSRFSKAASAFGLSPSARTGLQVQGGSDG